MMLLKLGEGSPLQLAAPPFTHLSFIYLTSFISISGVGGSSRNSHAPNTSPCCLSLKYFSSKIVILGFVPNVNLEYISLNMRWNIANYTVWLLSILLFSKLNPFCS